MLRSRTLLVFLTLSLAACSKARGDDFSKFRPVEKLETPGATPRVTLRYRPTPGEDAVYQLSATRSTKAGASAKKNASRLRLRVALHLSDKAKDRSFQLRLLNVLRLEPSPPDNAPEVGPAHVLLQGLFGPRGSLDRLEASNDLALPVNLTLLSPMLLPTYPTAAVGAGAKWRIARRYGWSRQQAADSLTQRPGFHGRTDLLLRQRTTLTRFTTQKERAQAVLTTTIQGQLRSHTFTLGHHTQHEGTATGTVHATVDRTTGLPESVILELKGIYQLRANDASTKTEERLRITLTRER